MFLLVSVRVSVSVYVSVLNKLSHHYVVKRQIIARSKNTPNVDSLVYYE